MPVLFFDTETTGFLNDKVAIDSDQQPWLLQLGCRLDADDGELLAELTTLVKVPEGTEVPEGALNVHGITADKAINFGIDPMYAISTFHMLAMVSDTVVAHNLDYDMGILRVAYARLGRSGRFTDELQPKNAFCTMKNTVDIVKAPGRGNGYKWPKLIEAYQVLVDPEGFQNAHDAGADMLACRDVFYALKSRQASPQPTVGN